jgi:hypothetical protein
MRIEQLHSTLDESLVSIFKAIALAATAASFESKYLMASDSVSAVSFFGRIGATR